MDATLFWLLAALGYPLAAALVLRIEGRCDRRAEERIRARMQALGMARPGPHAPAPQPGRDIPPWPMLSPPGFGRRLPALLAPMPRAQREGQRA